MLVTARFPPYTKVEVGQTLTKVLAMADATKVLHEFALWCAEKALLREREAGREPDARSWAAIEVKRRWLKGEATDEELHAARAAARAAAWAVARDAAASAARATARATARAAARVAAAVGAAARVAAASVAWSVAWDAERDWQNAELTRMLEEEIDYLDTKAKEGAKDA